MDKLSGKRTNRVKKEKEANPLNTKLSTTQKYIIAIILGALFALYEIGQKEDTVIYKKHECEERLDRSLGPASLGGGGVVRGLLKAGCGAGGDEHHHRHRHRRW